VLVGYLLLKGSLPKLDGAFRVSNLSAPVEIHRDAQGIPTIVGASRADLACGLGFVHAQDRLFQMDLLRRYAAGTLAELVGPAALQTDRDIRLHRFQALAPQVVAGLDSQQRAELEAYARGVNAGYASLGVRPFEYLLLRADPEPWTAQDSVLVMLTMFLTLEKHDFPMESALGVASDTLPKALFELLAAPGDEWDAPLEGPSLKTPALPGPDVFDLRREATDPFDPPDKGRSIRVPPGSNNWAVAGSHTSHGGAILANDMHMGLSVPNIWYRAGMVWRSARDGEERRAWGASLPGGPGLVIGSNRRVAWGLTNSEGDWADLVRLEMDPNDPTKYRTPAGYRPFETFTEIIRVRGQADVERSIRWTCWGPVLDDTEYHRRIPHALRWLAHDGEILNLNYLDVLEARNLEEAVAAATRSSGPQCNFLVADAHGDIAWTIYGRIPRRVGFNGRIPASWADGSRRWDGYLDPSKTPRLLRPPSGRLWTANNRVLAGKNLDLLGYGGYDRGARAKQIRDRLNRDGLSEADMLAIQLDDEAVFLARWQKLLLEVLDHPKGNQVLAHRDFRRQVAQWGGRAAATSVGFRLVNDFRTHVTHAVLAPLTARCRRVDSTIDITLFRSQEGAVWRLLQERPLHLLDPRYSSWDEMLQATAEHLASDLSEDGRSWGQRNRVRIRHPLSAGVRSVPVAGRLLDGWLELDMAAQPLDGGWADMPRVQKGAFGASERMAVSPGREHLGYFHMPCGQSAHPLSPHYRNGHAAWADGQATPFVPDETVHTLTLFPAEG
jgi:penicillin amidase